MWKQVASACVRSQFSHVRLFTALWTVAHQAPLSMGFSRQYWKGLLCPPRGYLTHPRIKFMSLKVSCTCRWGGSEVKASACNAETWVWFLGWEDPLEKEMAPYSSTLAWRIPWTEKPGRLQSMWSQRVRYDWATSSHTHSLFTTSTTWEAQDYCNIHIKVGMEW